MSCTINTFVHNTQQILCMQQDEEESMLQLISGGQGTCVSGCWQPEGMGWQNINIVQKQIKNLDPQWKNPYVTEQIGG